MKNKAWYITTSILFLVWVTGKVQAARYLTDFLRGRTIYRERTKLSVTSAAAEEDGESRIFLFFLGPMAANAVRLASLCLI